MDPTFDPNLLPYDMSPAAIALWASFGAAPLIVAFCRAAVSSGMHIKHAPAFCLLVGLGGALVAAYTSELSTLIALILGTMAGASAYGAFLYTAPEINTNGD